MIRGAREALATRDAFRARLRTWTAAHREYDLIKLTTGGHPDVTLRPARWMTTNHKHEHSSGRPWIANGIVSMPLFPLRHQMGSLHLACCFCIASNNSIVYLVMVLRETLTEALPTKYLSSISLYASKELTRGSNPGGTT